MKTCVLHIGLHKTATTSLQGSLFESRERLLGERVRYLDLEPNHSVPLSLLLWREGSPHWGRHLAAGGAVAELERAIRSTEAGLQANLAAPDHEHLIISGEDLSGLPEPVLTAFKARLDGHFQRYRVVCYVRHPFEYVSSAAQEQVKLGRRLEDILRRRPRARIRETLQAYAAVFGREAISVSAFLPACLRDGDIVSDFIHRILDETAAARALASVQPVRRNDSLSSDAVLLIGALNARAMEQRAAAVAFRRARQFDRWAARLVGPKFRLTRREAAGYAEEVAEDLAFLADFTAGEVRFALDGAEALYFDEERPPADLSRLAELLNAVSLAEEDSRAMKLFLNALRGAGGDRALAAPALASIERAIALSSDTADLDRMQRDLTRFGLTAAAERARVRATALRGAPAAG